MSSINKWCNERQLTEEMLRETFELWWPKLENELKIEDIGITQEDNDIDYININSNKILEEILSLVQTQHKILRRPEELLSQEYLNKTIERATLARINPDISSRLSNLLDSLNKVAIDNTERLLLDENKDLDPLIIYNAKKINKICLSLSQTLNFLLRNCKYPEHSNKVIRIDLEPIDSD